MIQRNTFFTIIVPVYKTKEEYLHECLGSILLQSFHDFELILVDDGSPDNCGMICDEYARKDSRIQVIHQKNQGVSVARNNGIKKASGEWILFVDSDDWIETEALSILHDHLVKNPCCDILKFHNVCEAINGNFKMNCGLNDDHLYDMNNPKEREFLYHRVMGVSVAKNRSVHPVYYLWDKAYKRSFITHNNLTNPVGIPKSEDKIFIAECFEKMSAMFCVKDVLYHYRMNDESVCHRYSANLDQSRIQAIALLSTIAKRMDKELANLLGNPSYNKISGECERFVFGTITDVLYLKYYHPDNPDKRGRRKAALKFLQTEPFRSAIRNVPYRNLSKLSKLKKLMLRFGLVSTFCHLSLIYRK